MASFKSHKMCLKIASTHITSSIGQWFNVGPKKSVTQEAIFMMSHTVVTWQRISGPEIINDVLCNHKTVFSSGNNCYKGWPGTSIQEDDVQTSLKRIKNLWNDVWYFVPKDIKYMDLLTSFHWFSIDSLLSFCQTSSIRCTKSQHLNVSHLAVVFVQYIEATPVGFKLRMKM